jgi:hypothetical protein
MRASRSRYAAAALACAALAAAFVATCKTPPPPAAGAPRGSFCGTDLECDDGLVCSCGQCQPPGPTDLPPACNQTATGGCPKPFPQACVTSCTDEQFIANADCGEGGIESCRVGILSNSCVPDGGVLDGGPDGGCAQPSARDAGCITPTGCDGQTPFLCVPSCGSNDKTASVCVNDQYICDSPSTFPESNCIGEGEGEGAEGEGEGAPVDAGPCAADPKPLCLGGCNPLDSFDGARCLPDAGPGGAFDWSCAGFRDIDGGAYIAADQCDGGE